MQESFPIKITTVKYLPSFILSLILLGIWGCSDSGSDPLGDDCSGILDCAGVCDGNAVNDDCGVCNGNGSTCNISYSQIQSIFDANCTSCHGNSGGLNLSSGSSYNNLYNVVSHNYSPALRIEPNNATNSVLYNKIANTEIYGDYMPKGNISGLLSDEDAKLIKTWINEGARLEPLDN